MFPEVQCHPIYLDHAATSPLRDEALEVMIPLFRDYRGNPSSAHSAGRAMHSILDEARERIASCVNAHPQEIFFTSGGTESNNWAISIGKHFARMKNSVIVSDPIEHHSVLYPLKAAQKEGIPVRYLPVRRDGTVNQDHFGMLCEQQTAFASVMLVNNETGVVQPVNRLAAIMRKLNIPLHTDAVQAVGHIPIDLSKLDVDYLSSSAHKFGGPVGVGFLYVRNGAPAEPFLLGGAQERGRRAGTENVALCAGMAAALETSVRNMEQENRSIRLMQDIMEKTLLTYPGAHIHGSAADRISGTINICFPGVQAIRLIPCLDMNGIAVSAGAACTAGSLEISHVLIGMGIEQEMAQCSIRISVGRINHLQEIQKAAEIILREAKRIGKITG